MKALFRQGAIKLLSLGPVPALWQHVRKKYDLTIITYHAVVAEPLPFDDWCYLDLERFRQQVAYLSRNFRIIPMSEAAARLRAGGFDEPTAVITFDDGYQNNFDVAFPILQQYRAPAMLYLVTDLIGTERTFWFTRLLLALQSTQKAALQWLGAEYPLTTPALRARSSQRLQRLLKKLPAAELDRAILEIEALLAVPAGETVAADSPLRMLDRASIAIMQASGLIEFGAHTCAHQILSRLAPEQKRAQILASLQGVEALTGQACRHFAYPNGGKGDYDADCIRVLAEAGVETATTMIPGPATADQPVLQMNRYAIGSDITFERFKLMVHQVV